jgi:hypothetical protein
MPPEILSLAEWTELCELCDWDEVKAAKLLEATRLETRRLMPEGRRLEICRSLLARQSLIDKKQNASIPAAEA